MTSYWIGIASYDHVRTGVEGGFCQLGHGKRAPVERLKKGDWICYYSPREEMGRGESVQAFTAIGRISDEEAYRGDMANNFHPWRRDVAWKRRAKQAPIRPLLQTLDLTRGRRSWGIIFRRSVIMVDEVDFARIASAMGIKLG